MNDRLAGKVALITGGARGLGAAMATRLKAEGAVVYISDLLTEAGEATAKAGGFAFLEQDVTSPDRWGQVMDHIVAAHGRIDILVNNAAIVGGKANADPEHIVLEDWRRMFAVNLDSVMLGCQAAIRAMRPAGTGSIVNMSSIAGLKPSSYAAAYGCSKAAVRHLTQSVAQYCGEQGLKIRCNSVHPGNTMTDMYGGWIRTAAEEQGIAFETMQAREIARVPLGEYMVPDDIAAAVAFLASDDARMITGMRMIVDGGTVEVPSYLSSDVYRRKILEIG